MPDFTTNGVPYADTNDMVNVPATGQVLANFLDPFVPNWQTPRQGRQVSRAAVTTAQTGQWTSVNGFELGNTFSVGVTYGAGVFTFNRAGLYLVTATVYWPYVASTQSFRLIGGFYLATGGGAFALDGLARGRDDILSPATRVGGYKSYTAVIPFNVGDQVQLWLYADSPNDIPGVVPTTFAVAALA